MTVDIIEYNEDCLNAIFDHTLSTCWDIEININKVYIDDDIKNLRIILKVLKKYQGKKIILKV